MSLFRKLGQSLVPMFRKLPGQVSTIGRKISNTSKDIDRGLAQAENVVSQIDKFAPPNPLTKTVKGAIGSVRDITGGVGMAGQALRKGAEGDVQGAISLGKSALQKGTEGLGELAETGATLALL